MFLFFTNFATQTLVWIIDINIMKKKREIATVITAITGDRVIVGKQELEHAMLHFILPEDIFLELLERVLKDPHEVYLDDTKKEKEYHLFYKILKFRYILAIVKVIEDGAYFTSMYTTGEDIRNSHKKLKKLKL